MATINEKFIPLAPIHPSELIKDELKARGMQRKELAARLGMKAPNLSRLLNAKESITPAMALKLEGALGIPADYWMGLQVSYERDKEAIRQRDGEEAKAIQVEKALAAFYESSSWLYHKLDGIDGNGGRGGFKPEEAEQLRGALLDLSERLRRAAEKI